MSNLSTDGAARGRDFRDEFYASYVSGHQVVIDEQTSMAQFEQDILVHVPRAHSSRILDVGCGQGRLVRALVSRGYASARGIDTSGEQIALAHELGTPNVEQADLFDFAERHDAAFDVVIAIDLIEHFDREDVAHLFRTLARLLRPGGVCIVQTPNGSSPFSGRVLYSDLTHGVVYTERSLRQAGHLAGFSSFDAFPVRPSGKTYLAVVRRVLWRVIEGLIKLPLIVETGQVRGHVVTQNLVGVGIKSA